MQFTGDQLFKKRNFYTQNGNFGVSVDFSVDNPSGKYEFGVSGTSNMALTLESGQIKYDGLFIQSYLPFNNYSILLEITDNKLNYIQNDNEIIYGSNKPTGDYNYFYFNRDSTGINAEFDFYLSGKNLPLYNVERLGLRFNSGQQEVTGNFMNLSGYDINLFNSTTQGMQNLSYSFATGFFGSGQSSKFKYSGDLNSFDYSQPITTWFYTNFGNVGVNFKIVDISTLNKFVLLDELPDFSFNTNNEINRQLFYSNYSGSNLTNLFNTDIIFKLDYLAGSGSFTVDDFAQSAHFSANAYGNFSESGIVTGQTSIATGDSEVTGLYTVSFSRFQWATGAVTGFFSGNGTGLASGIKYTGLAYGGFTGFVTGLIRDGSGTFIFNDIFATGYPVNPLASINYTGYLNATGFLDLSGLSLGSSFFIGIESTPLVKGLQFGNETGLVYYLSGAPQHKVSSYFNGSHVLLESLFSGELGNGIFVRNFNCNDGGLINFSPILTSGTNFGTTGNAVYSIGQPISGFISTVGTGSGNYTLLVTDDLPGSFSFSRTFTGAWDLFTGLSQTSLAKVPEVSDVLISGHANLGPNSSVIFQIDHYDSSFNIDSVKFTITGADIFNPLTTTITQ